MWMRSLRDWPALVRARRDSQFFSVLSVHSLARVLAGDQAWGRSLPTDGCYHDPGGVFCDPLSPLKGTLGLSLGAGIFVYYGKGLQTFFKMPYSADL